MIFRRISECVSVMFYITAIFVVDAEIPECSQPTDDHPRIVGGITAAKGEMPWMVALFQKSKGRDQYHTSNVLCGASLISKTHILSAAHCFDSVDKPSDILVRLGLHDLKTSLAHTPEVMEFVPLWIYIHDCYNEDFLTDDIAIIKLGEEVEFSSYVRPICLPVDHDYNFAGWVATVTGWGLLEHGGTPSDVLLKVVLDVVSQKQCAKAYENESYVIDERVICAGYDHERMDSCQGDSGGPLFTAYDGNQYLIGIVSTGMKCADPNYYGIYTRVTSYLNWIDEHAV